MKKRSWSLFMLFAIAILFVLCIQIGPVPIETFSVQSKKVCCLYAYYEKNDEYKNNLEYFLQNGIRDDVDYYIIINGECSVDIAPLSNLIVLRRANTGFDFGAWQACIHKYLTSSVSYDYYFFLNSSVRGPLPSHVGHKWVDMFIALFGDNTDSPPVKLVGTTINVLQQIWSEYPLPFSPPYTHVQSMFFGLDRDAFEYLLNDCGFFGDDEELNAATDARWVISYKEISMSQLILRRGWNLNAMMPEYRNLNYQTVKVKPPGTSSRTREYRNCYDDMNVGSEIKEEDVIFFKTNASCANAPEIPNFRPPSPPQWMERMKYQYQFN